MTLFPTGRGPINVSPADVGRRLRVSAKRVLGGRGERTVEGVLFRWEGGYRGGILRIRTRAGIEVGVRASEVQHARVLPPEISVFDMQRLASQAWPPLEAENVGEWTLRCSRGASERANSVRVAGPPERSMRASLEHVRDWYRDRGQVARLQIPLPSGLNVPWDEWGWKLKGVAQLMTVSVPRLLSSTAPARDRKDLDIDIRDQPNGDWYSLVHDYDAASKDEYHQIMAATSPAAFIYCRDQSGELLGIGRAALQYTWCCLSNIEIVHQSRQRGIASALTSELARWAHEQGAERWYIQVYADNTAARSLYERYGFTTHHRYEYRQFEDPEPQTNEHPK